MYKFLFKFFIILLIFTSCKYEYKIVPGNIKRTSENISKTKCYNFSKQKRFKH